MSTIPWAALKSSGLILLTVSVIAGTGIWWSTTAFRQAEKARIEQYQTSEAAKQKLQQFNADKEVVGQYQGAYQALITRGFIGPETRLAWLEAVQQANRDAGLYGLDYSLEPRSLMPRPGTQVALGQSMMRIRMPILVEDDLGNFLKALQQRNPGIFRVRSCQITRAADAPPQPINKPELEAECELLWLTIAPPERTS